MHFRQKEEQYQVFPRQLEWKELALPIQENIGNVGSLPGWGRSCSRKWHPILVFLPENHGRVFGTLQSMEAYKEPDTRLSS